MDYRNVAVHRNNIVLEGVVHFDLDEILDCGQCFRWEKLGEKCYSGVAFGKELTLAQQEDRLIFQDTTLADFQGLWHGYFDFERDYGEIKSLLRTDPAMNRAVQFCPGMRVVRQEPWEALCSFIISQNNNIPRIKGIVKRLCECFGDPLPRGGYTFPAPQRLAALELEDLAVIRSGFRGKYILDAAGKIAGGELPLPELHTLGLQEARGRLMCIKGVGPKVADCALLYGFARAECLPVDVWIARALKQLYPEGFPQRFAEVAGIGQQYLFHYIRNR